MKTHIYLLFLITIGFQAFGQVGSTASDRSNGSGTYPKRTLQEQSQQVKNMPKDPPKRELLEIKTGISSTNLKSSPLLNKVTVNPKARIAGKSARIIFIRDILGIATPIDIYLNDKKVGSLDLNSSLEYYFNPNLYTKNIVRIESDPKVIYKGENKKLTSKLEFRAKSEEEIYISCNFFVDEDNLSIKRETNVDKSYLEKPGDSTSITTSAMTSVATPKKEDVIIDNSTEKREMTKSEILDEYNKGNYEKIINTVRASANAGDADYQYLMGNLYFYGYGVTRDEGKAEWYYKEAVNNPNPPQMFTKTEALNKIESMNNGKLSAKTTKPKSKKKFAKALGVVAACVAIVVLLVLDGSLATTP